MSLKLRWVNKLSQARKRRTGLRTRAHTQGSQCLSKAEEKDGCLHREGRKEVKMKECLGGDFCLPWEAGGSSLAKRRVGQVGCKGRMMGMVKVSKSR